MRRPWDSIGNKGWGSGWELRGTWKLKQKAVGLGTCSWVWAGAQRGCSVPATCQGLALCPVADSASCTATCSGGESRAGEKPQVTTLPFPSHTPHTSYCFSQGHALLGFWVSLPSCPQPQASGRNPGPLKLSCLAII